MRKALWGILLFWLIAYIYITNRTPERAPVSSPAAGPAPAASPGPSDPDSAREPAPQPSAGHAIPETAPPEPKLVTEKTKMALRYKIHNGLFIVQGDVVAGAVIQGQNPPPDGLVEMEPVELWPRVIPYHIQPDVVAPERVEAAIRMFDGTAVQFVKHGNEEYALVFEQGDKHCLSYIGKVVAKQQIWISPNCAPDDIAHEILHALGFVHEQNRSDRDNFLDVHPDNIEEEYVHNFEKLPQDFMKVSGLAEFDYQSLMMYPPTMFAKGGRNTMEPKNRDRIINPEKRLSRGDIDRLNRAYGR